MRGLEFPRPLRILEIGVFEGRTACWFCKHLLREPGERYFGIDPWDPAKMTGRRYRGRAEEMTAGHERTAKKALADYPQAELLKGYSRDVIPAMSKAAGWEPRGAWPPGYFGLIYVDGEHYFDPVMADSRLCWPLLNPEGGIMVWDDYRMRRRQTGVQEAVDAFLEEHRGEYEDLFSNGQRGIRRVS